MATKKYLDLTGLSTFKNKITSEIPTKTSDLTNDSGFITDSKVVVIDYGSNTSATTIKSYLDNGYSVFCKYNSIAIDDTVYNYAPVLYYCDVAIGTDYVVFGTETLDSEGKRKYLKITLVGTRPGPKARAVESGWQYELVDIQEKLVSGTNIKTINNTSLLGSGDISFETIQDISGDINIKNLATGIYRIYGGDYGCDVYYNSTDSLSVPSMAYAYLIVTVFPDIYTVNSWTFMGNSSEFYYGYCWGSHGYCYSVTSAEAQEAITGILSNLTTTAKTNLVSAINELDSDKQETLVSGTNIKTINNQSILGSGNINISGGATKTIMQAVKTSDTTSYSTSYNYFSPFNGDGDASTDINIGSGLTFEKKLVTYGDRTNNSVYGVTIGAGISLIKVYYSTRYLNNHTANVGVNSNIYRKSADGTPEIVYGTTTTMPSSTRAVLTGEYYMEVQEGDFIFIGGYRTLKASDVDVISTNNATSMYVEVIQ